MEHLSTVITISVIFYLFGIIIFAIFIWNERTAKKIRNSEMKFPATIIERKIHIYRDNDGFYRGEYNEYIVEYYKNGTYLTCNINDPSIFQEGLQTYVVYNPKNNSFTLGEKANELTGIGRKNALLVSISSFLIAITIDIFFVTYVITKNKLVPAFGYSLIPLAVAVIITIKLVKQYLDTRNKITVEGIIIDIKSYINKNHHYMYSPIIAYKYKDVIHHYVSARGSNSLPAIGTTTEIYIGKSGKIFEGRDTRALIWCCIISYVAIPLVFLICYFGSVPTN